MVKDELFQFINPSLCDKLSELKGKDLQRLIVLLENHFVTLRDNLGLDNNITYGLELEFENIKNYYNISAIDLIKKKLLNTGWITKRDGTLNLGVEINSPVLKDTKESWQFLDDLLKYVKSFVEVGDKSGGHIHIGTQILGNNREAWLHLLKIWSAYENIIYRFTNGEFITGRKIISEYAMPVKDDFDHYYDVLKDYHINAIISFLKTTRRYQAVNFWNIKEYKLDEEIFGNTIEFRSPNSSLSSVVWQNNVNLFTKLLIYCKSDHYNTGIVDRRLETDRNQYNNLIFYDEIFLEQALEFTDMIFTNNLDKLYFLKQYLKSFELKKENIPKNKLFKKK